MEMADGLIWFDCGRRDPGGANGRGDMSPGSKAASCCRTPQGKAGTSLAMTVSLPCKLPTGLIWHRVFKKQDAGEKLF